MKAEYPSDHKAGMRVPRGGSSCASCEYLGKDRKTCTNEYFQKWHGSANLPAPPEEYCSDWYDWSKTGRKVNMPVPQGKKGVEMVMKEFGKGQLRSGSKKGPVVGNRKQAVAIALNQAGMSNKK